MEKSPSLKELATALNKFQGLMGVVVFDSNNPFFKSKYASLSTIVSTAKPILAQCGLSVSQLTEGEGGVTTILMHNSGEFLSSTLTLKAVKDDPQGHGSAITYARRYAYASILGIVSDEDDDGNEATQVSQNKSQSKPEVKSSVPMPEMPTLRGMINNLAKDMFQTPDDFKFWRVDNGFEDNMDGLSDLELAKIISKLREKKGKK